MSRSCVIPTLTLQSIKNYINPQYHNYFTEEQVKIVDQIDSTNDYLLKLVNKNDNKIMFCLAESQTSGKGQFNRIWFSPKNNIYLSLLWLFKCNLNKLTTLSEEIAKSLNNSLNKYGVLESYIKKPNDILYQNRKLAGILIETIGKPTHNYCYAIIGLGVNVNLPRPLPLNSGLSLTKIIDIAEIIQKQPNINKLTGIIIEGLLTTVLKY